MPSKEQSKSKIRVLLCDDHALVREGTRRLLEEEPDIEVVGEASDGFEAIEMAKRFSPDVIAMDVSMPRMNGIEATKKIKEDCPGIFDLALTAYDDLAYVSRLIESGASGYILKSARSKELIQAVKATALGEFILDPAVARQVFSRIARRSGQLNGEVFASGIVPASVPSAGKDFVPGSDSDFKPDPHYQGSKPGSRTASQPDYQVLTERETEILKLAARGLSNKEIAFELSISPRTIQSHLSSVFGKLGVASRTQAVVAALQRGIIAKEDVEVKSIG